MSKKKKRVTKRKKINPATLTIERDNPTAQKFALIIFGLGPIILMGWYLLGKGFFDPIG